MTFTLSGPEVIPRTIKSAVILLHGLGSNGDDLISLVPYFKDSLPTTAFFSPNAPFPVPMTFNGYQWFDLWDRTQPQIEDSVRTNSKILQIYINNLSDTLNLPLSKIALVGFSQGTMMALHVGLRMLDGLAGIVGYSGTLVDAETLPKEHVKNMPPVLLVHGMADPIVPAMASQFAESSIRQVGGDVRLIQRPFLMHSVDDVGLKEAAAFLKANLN